VYVCQCAANSPHVARGSGPAPTAEAQSLAKARENKDKVNESGACIPYRTHTRTRCTRKCTVDSIHANLLSRTEILSRNISGYVIVATYETNDQCRMTLNSGKAQAAKAAKPRTKTESKNARLPPSAAIASNSDMHTHGLDIASGTEGVGVSGMLNRQGKMPASGPSPISRADSVAVEPVRFRERAQERESKRDRGTEIPGGSNGFGDGGGGVGDSDDNIARDGSDGSALAVGMHLMRSKVRGNALRTKFMAASAHLSQEQVVLSVSLSESVCCFSLFLSL